MLSTHTIWRNFVHALINSPLRTCRRAGDSCRHNSSQSRKRRYAAVEGRIEPLEVRCLLSATAGLIDFSALQTDVESYDSSHVLVQFEDHAQATGQRLGQTSWYQVQVEDGLTVLDAVSNWRGQTNVLYAQPDYTVRIQDHNVPNDFFYAVNELWGLNNVAKGGIGTDDADIDAPEAWHVTTGSSNVVVAVIDTGVDYTHPDLRDNMWVNPGEIAGNGVDDDGNLYVDDVYGYDFHNNDNDPMDDNGHGTHVAGTIGAAGNNGGSSGTEIVGVAWDVSIMALKFLSASGSGSTSNAIRALDYATQMREWYNDANDTGANVVLTNNSWGGGGYDQALKDAIDRSGDAGMLFVAAAGNGDRFGRGQDNDAKPHYPSSYTSENIIAVAATNRNDQYASFSNYGNTSVDLAAPGVEIWSTIPFAKDTSDGSQDGYTRYNGTSMATPHVSGAAALVWAANPNLTAAEVKGILLQTVDPITGRETVTDGRLNVGQAVQTAAELAVPSLSIGDVSVVEGDGDTVDAVFTVTLSRASSQDVTVNYSIIDGTATTADGDYTATAYNGTLTFAANTTALMQEIRVAVTGDTRPEPDETFFVSLHDVSPNARIADDQGQGTILDDEPSITISDVTVVEGNSGTVDAVFTVTLSRASSQDVTVNYTTADGTATAGSDYTALGTTTEPLTLTFAAGETSKTIVVAVNGDTANESHETFFVDLTSVSANAAIADSRGVATITNDDETVSEFRSTDVPAPLRGRTATVSYLTISQDLQISDLDVRLDVNHSRLADLDVYLYHPDGSRVALYWGGDSSGNLTNAVFDDEGRRPVQPLSSFDGKSTQGTWQLRVENWGSRKGQLNSWSLVVTSATAVSSTSSSIASMDAGGRTGSAVRSGALPTASAPTSSELPFFVSPSLTVLSGNPQSSVPSDQPDRTLPLRRINNFGGAVARPADETPLILHEGPLVSAASGTRAFASDEFIGTISGEGERDDREDDEPISLNLSDAGDPVFGDAEGLGHILDDNSL